MGPGAGAYAAAAPGETHQATGCKAGEMTLEPVRFWLRRSAAHRWLANGIVRKGHGDAARVLAADIRIESLEGSAAGQQGIVRVVYAGVTTGATPWLDVNEYTGYAARANQKGRT